MSFKESLSIAWDILSLDSSAVRDAATDTSSTGWAFLIIILAGVASAIGSLNPIGIIVAPIFMILAIFLWTFILWVLAMIFGGRAGFMELFRPLGHSSIIAWITVIPLIGPILSFFTGIWNIVMSVVIVREVFGFTTGRAVVVVLIPVIIGLIVMIALFVWLMSVIGSLIMMPPVF